MLLFPSCWYWTYPGRPPDSMWFAVVTSSDHTSYCHFFRPRTPLWTLPMCTPTLMLRLTPVASRTLLFGSKSNITHHTCNALILVIMRHSVIKKTIVECKGSSKKHMFGSMTEGPIFFCLSTNKSLYEKQFNNSCHSKLRIGQISTLNKL